MARVWVNPIAAPPTGDLTLATVLDAVYPVGAIYTSVVSTSPATLFGFGTWLAIAAGRALVVVDPNDADFNAAEKTAGAKTVAAAGTNSGGVVTAHGAHTHDVTSNVTVTAHDAHTHSVTSNVAVDNHTSHTHTYTDVPNHVHTNSAFTDVASATTGSASTHYQTLAKTTDNSSTQSDFTPPNTGNPTTGVATGTTAGPNATITHGITNNAVTSGNPSASLTHSVTNNAVTSGNPSASLTHSVTDPTFTGTATSVVQPSFCIYAWKRTA